MNDIMKLIDDVPGGDGFYYWEAGWIPVPGSGWATEGALSYIEESGPCGNEWANQALFDYDGHALPALKTIRDYKPAARATIHLSKLWGTEVPVPSVPVVSDSKVHIFDTFGYVLAGWVCV